MMMMKLTVLLSLLFFHLSNAGGTPSTNFILVGELEFISLSVNSPPINPFPRKYGTGGRRPPTKRFPTGYGDMRQTGNGNHGKWRLNFLPVPDRPTYTPYIGARALTNIPKFFDHLRENLDAFLKSKEGTDGRGHGQPLTKRIAAAPTSTRQSFVSKSDSLTVTPSCVPDPVPRYGPSGPPRSQQL